jgi:hypothetical protein
MADKIDREKIIAKVRKIHSKEVGVGQANSWVCPECKHETRIDKESMTFKFNPEVIVQDITIDRCENCGFECVSEEEYEKVRKLVHQVKAPFKPHGASLANSHASQTPTDDEIAEKVLKEQEGQRYFQCIFQDRPTWRKDLITLLKFAIAETRKQKPRSGLENSDKLRY